MLKIKLELSGQHIGELRITRRGAREPEHRYGIEVVAGGQTRDLVAGDTSDDRGTITIDVAPGDEA